jgi:hypothetical protein
MVEGGGSDARIRLAAIGLPLLALGAGAVAGSSVGALVVRAVGLGAVAGAVALARAGRWAGRPNGPSRASPDGGQTGPLRIVVAAHDEAGTIAGLVGDLAAALADGRTDAELVVVDDRSTDGTGDVASAAIRATGLGPRARVVRRASGPDGKAAALAGAVGETPPDAAVLVLDADARVPPAFPARVLGALRETPAITARRRMLRPRNPGRVGAILAALQDDEQLADDLVQRGRLALGGAAELRGDGMAFRRAALDALGGWPADALCEDLELSVALYAASGRGAARPRDLVVWEQPVLRPRELVRQRIRWAEGSVRRDLRVVLPALLDPSVRARRRADVAAAAAQDLVPWLGWGLVVRALGSGDGAARARRLALELAGAYLAAGLILGGTALSRRPAAGARVLATLAFSASWTFVLPVAWIRVARCPGRAPFRRTPHLHAPPRLDVVPAPGRDEQGRDGDRDRGRDRVALLRPLHDDRPGHDGQREPEAGALAAGKGDREEEQPRARELGRHPVAGDGPGGEDAPHPERIAAGRGHLIGGHRAQDEDGGRDEGEQRPTGYRPGTGDERRDEGGGHPNTPSAVHRSASVMSIVGAWTRTAVHACPRRVGNSATGTPTAWSVAANDPYCTP